MLRPVALPRAHSLGPPNAMARRSAPRHVLNRRRGPSIPRGEPSSHALSDSCRRREPARHQPGPSESHGLRDDRSPGSARPFIPTGRTRINPARSRASRAPGDPITDFRHKGEERLSRQQAAERLIDLAYALVTGGPLRLESDLQVTVAGEVVLKRDGNSKDDRVLLEMELSWSTRSAPRDPVA